MRTLEELSAICNRMKSSIALREGESDVKETYRKHVLICGGTGCTSSGSVKIREAMEAELAAAGLTDEIKVVLTGCFGLCANGPIVIVYPEGTFYSRVAVEDVKEIVSEHFQKGVVVSRLVHKEAGDDGQIKEKALRRLRKTSRTTLLKPFL